MAFLNIGCDFSIEHARVIAQLAKESYCKVEYNGINCVYGSPKMLNPFGSVRPYSRETVSDTSDFNSAISLLKDQNIHIALALNSLFPHYKGSSGKHNLDLNVFKDLHIQEALLKFVNTMSPLVNFWIISHPFLIDFFHEYAENEQIIISTIMNVHSVKQVEWIKENWPNVVAICPALWRNRDFKFLSRANRILPLELLANEFCTIGGVECEGLYRQACYLTQSMETDEMWNPMLTRCIESREKNPESWIKARFILPQWFKRYEEITGVRAFKLTGRTHNADYILQIGRMYMQGRATGNLLELWGQLQASLNRANWHNEQIKASAQVDIPIEKIEEKLINIIGSCSEMCDQGCTYCDSLFKGLKSGK